MNILEKTYDHISTHNGCNNYNETDGLVAARLYLETYGFFPNVITLEGSDDIDQDDNKEYWFSLESTIEALENNGFKFSVRAVNRMDNDGKLFDRHYTLHIPDRKCIIYIDELSSGDNPSYEHELYYKDYSDIKDIVELIWKNSFNVKDITLEKKLYFIVQFNGGYDLVDREIKEIDVDIAKNYNDDFIEADKIITEFINNDDAGLLIFNGIMGSGKTTYIRNLISKCNKKFVFATQDIVNCIADPGFTRFLMDLKDSILILEDCENVVSSRDQGNRSSAISNILNMCDGLLSDILNIKIIVTFNTNLNNIDTALLRKGRLKYQYTFGSLCVEKTKALLKELYGDDYDTDNVTKPMILADIYNIEDNNAMQTPRKTIGFN